MKLRATLIALLIVYVAAGVGFVAGNLLTPLTFAALR